MNDSGDRTHGTSRTPTGVPGLSNEHAREWRQFARWAIAADLLALPATAVTVLTYLDEHPGTPATQRGRVTALNTAHARTNHPLPGAAEAVRRALNPDRAGRLAGLASQAEAVIAHLPVFGWPHALDGRRDAVLLTLSTSGLSWHQIAGLRQSDVSITSTAVTVGAQPLIELPATSTATTCPVQVFSRWAAVLAHAPAATGHVRLANILARESHAESIEPIPMPEEYQAQPLLCAFDHRGLAIGYIDELTPLTPEFICDVVTTHLLAVRKATDTALDPGWFEHGIAARWRSKKIHDELDDLLDRFDALADQFPDLGFEFPGA